VRLELDPVRVVSHQQVGALAVLLPPPAVEEVEVVPPVGLDRSLSTLCHQPPPLVRGRARVRVIAVSFCPQRCFNLDVSRPASRLLAFLELLQSRLVVAGAGAAHTRRTRQRGLGGGPRWGAGAPLPPLMLSDEEAAAAVFGLVMAEQRGLSGAEGALT